MSALQQYSTVQNYSPWRMPGYTLNKCPGQTVVSPDDWGSHLLPPISEKQYEPLAEEFQVLKPYNGIRQYMPLPGAEIKFTNYSIGTTRYYRRLVKVPRKFRLWTKPYWPGCHYLDTLTGTVSWDDVYDVARWTAHHGPVVSEEDPASSDAEIFSAINRVRSQAWVESLSSFDLLTQIAEARETVETVNAGCGAAKDQIAKVVAKNRKSWKKGRHLNVKALLRSADKGLRRLGGSWLLLRYGIMPIVYSFQSLNETLEQAPYKYHRVYKGTDMTEKSNRPDCSGTMTYSTRERISRVRACVAWRYKQGLLQSFLDKTAFNPFRTAWELIPLSFVVDWFVNVGDAIYAATNIDLASQRVGYSSVRKRWKTEVFAYDDSTDYSQRSFVQPEYPSNEYNNWEYTRQVEELLELKILNSYERRRFTNHAVKLEFDPNLFWQRQVDGLALAYQPTKNVLKRLAKGIL